jgi:hypothetical protein
MLGMDQVQVQVGKYSPDLGREGKGYCVLMMGGGPKGRESEYSLLLSIISRVVGCKDEDLVPSGPELLGEDLNRGGKAVDQGPVVAGKDADVHLPTKTRGDPVSLDSICSGPGPKALAGLISAQVTSG